MLVAMKGLIAEHKFENFGIGEIMRDIVFNDYILPLQEAIEEGVRPKVEREYQAKITEWVEYTEPDIWNKLAMVVVHSMLRKQGFKQTNNVPMEDLEDAVSDASVAVLTAIKRKTAFAKHVDPFDMDKGPDDLKSVFSRVVNHSTNKAIVHRRRHAPTLLPLDTGDEEKDDPGMDIVDPHSVDIEMVDRIDEKTVDKLYKDLLAYVKRMCGRDEVKMLIFRWWLKAVDKLGTTEKVKFKTHVFRPLADKLKKEKQTLAYTTATRKWKELKTVIVSFFEKQMKWELTDRLRRKLLKASEIIAIEHTRRSLAAWVLGKKCLAFASEDGYVTPESMVEELREERKRKKSTEAIQ
jgi:hypothetical protein